MNLKALAEVKMDARDAITNAKRHFLEIFAEEGITNLRLEEVRYDSSKKTWQITLGFTRKSEYDSNISKLTGKYTNPAHQYKIVELSDMFGELLSITNRESHIQ